MIGTIAAAAALLAATQASALDFLYVAANEGGSSGGHVALRVDRTVFHYVHEAPGLVRLRREDARAFERRYRLIENRSIRASRVEADDETVRLVRHGFTRRWIAQERRLARLAALRDERRLLEAVAAVRTGQPGDPLAFAGPGYFLADDGAPRRAGREEPALARVRDAIARTRGAAFLDERIAAARDALAPPAGDSPATATPPARGHLLARRYEDLVVRLRALEILRAATPLRGDAVRSTGVALRPEERTALRSLARGLRARTVALLDSRRPDRGFPLVVGLARLAAIERSLQAGAWIVLDVLPVDGDVLAPRQVARHRQAIADARAENARAFVRARRALVAAIAAGTRLPERRLAIVERAAGRWTEAEHALAAPVPLRLVGDLPVPARPMRHARPSLPWPDAVLAAAIEDARDDERRHRVQIQALYGYDLVRRNCATELLRTWHDVLDARPRAGVGVGRAVLDFVPLLASARLGRHPAVAETTLLPSRRRAALARLARRDPALLVGVRESNTLTATTYDRNPDDSLFLFFTDGAPLVRPLLGGVNLGVGLGATLAGVAALPVDRGHLLRAGLRGALYSLPELAFVNVRKGTYDRVVPGGPADGLPGPPLAR